MDIQEHINTYLGSLEEAKRIDMEFLHQRLLEVYPSCKLWFLDGKDASGKVVSNPNIGYGHCTLQYADGTSREFYKIGLSANTTGISVYIMGLKDKTYLAQTYGHTIGKASVTGYCIKFKTLKDINIDILEEAIQYGMSVPE